MSKRICFLFGLVLPLLLAGQTDFKQQQQKAARVKAAYQDVWPSLSMEVKKQLPEANSFEMLIRVFKADAQLEVWLKPKGTGYYKLFKTYPVCASSGELGPKRKQGDGQVPEGFYKVSVFNPYSSYYLSLGVSYPNESDRILGKGNLGGDIMIHGNCVTIGCMPITDPKIKEVYLLAVEARNAGQSSIPVQIFPTRFTDKSWQLLQQTYATDDGKIAFWNNLKEGYDYFEKNKKPSSFTVNSKGAYVFSK